MLKNYPYTNSLLSYVFASEKQTALKTCGEQLKHKSILGGFGLCFPENI